MALSLTHGRLRTITAEAVVEATGQEHRHDAVLSGTGGPAGNARLTAWTGLVLTALFLAELITTLDTHGLLSWHVAIGALLIPPALVKTSSTGWRMVRYYTGHRPYRNAGPPSLIMRVLGPLVVVTTLALLGTGFTLILLGPSQADGGLFDVRGLHSASFVAWAVVTGLHVLGRLIPALQLTVGADARRIRVPGRHRRGAALAATAAVAAALAVLLVHAAGPWRAEHRSPFGPPGVHARR